MKKSGSQANFTINKVKILLNYYYKILYVR